MFFVGVSSAAKVGGVWLVGFGVGGFGVGGFLIGVEAEGREEREVWGSHND